MCWLSHLKQQKKEQPVNVCSADFGATAIKAVLFTQK